MQLSRPDRNGFNAVLRLRNSNEMSIEIYTKNVYSDNKKELDF